MKKKLNANDQYFFGTPEGAKMISIEMNDPFDLSDDPKKLNTHFSPDLFDK